MKESDLFAPLAEYFTKQGYRVQGEVCGCDLVAVGKNDDELVIVELKVSFNTKLLYQAVRRLPITPQVYIAIPRPATRQKMSYWQMIKSLARRLQIGVFVLSEKKIQVLVEPAPFSHRTSTPARRRLLKELNGRRVAKNTGGVTGQKLQTAYLENAVHIAALLKKLKQSSAAELRSLGTGEKTHTTLYKNVYGWFERKAPGVYALKARQAARIQKEHPEIWQYYAGLVETAGKARRARKKK